MNNNDDFFEYFRTVLITAFAAFLMVIGMLVFAQFQAYSIVQNQDSPDIKVNKYLVHVLIDQNKYLSIQNPKDYKLNIKLGVLYEYCDDLKNAEIQYKTAISKTDFNDYTPYKYLALLYIKENKLSEAANVIDVIDERPYPPLIEIKGYIYAIIADVYYEHGDYENAIDYYQRSLIYYKAVKNSGAEKTVTDSMASAYVYSAEKYISSLDHDDAIEALDEADKLEHAPIIEYKLALLLMASEPARAYKYFQMVFNKEPSIINFDIYYGFIKGLALEAEAKGDAALGELYRYRAKKYQEYFESHIITVDDINLQYIQTKMSYNIFSRKYKINLQMKLRNTAERPIRSLYTIIQFKEEDGTPIANYITQVVDEKSVLAPSYLTPMININEYKRKSFSDKHPKKVVAFVYFAISPNSYKVHLATVRISEKHVEKRGSARDFNHHQKFSLDFLKRIVSREKI